MQTLEKINLSLSIATCKDMTENSSRSTGHLMTRNSKKSNFFYRFERLNSTCFRFSFISHMNTCLPPLRHILRLECRIQNKNICHIPHGEHFPISELFDIQGMKPNKCHSFILVPLWWKYFAKAIKYVPEIVLVIQIWQFDGCKLRFAFNFDLTHFKFWIWLYWKR